MSQLGRPREAKPKVDESGRGSAMEWTWYPFNRLAIKALAREFSLRLEAGTHQDRLVKALKAGPRKGERCPLAEVVIRTGGHGMIRVHEPSGPDWPSRTIARLRQAHTLLEQGLRTASGVAERDQPKALLAVLRVASDAVPDPVVRTTQPRRNRPRRIRVVSGGLPSLGKR